MNRKRLVGFAGIIFLLLFMIFALGCSEESSNETTSQDSNSEEKDENANEDSNSDQQNQTDTTEEVTLTFWHGYNPVETEHFDKNVIPAFEDEFEGITIDSIAVPYDQFYQKLLTSIAGGESPDLIRADLAWVPQLAELGALVPLNNLMDDFDQYKDSVFPGTLAPNYWEGDYFGLPLDTNTRVLFWNKTLFEEAGLSRPPETFEEFVEYAEKMTDQGNTWGFAEGGTGGWNVLPLIWSAGGDVTDDEVTQASGYLNSPESVELLEKLLEMHNQGTLAPSMMGDGLSTADGYAQNKYGMIIDGPWMVSIFEEQYADFEAQMAPLPQGDGGSVSVVGGQDIVMFQQSEQQEEAADFIRFMLRDETQLSMADVGQMPVLKHLEDDDYMKNHPFYGVFFEQMNTAKARTPHPEWPEIDSNISDAVTKVLLGQQTPQEALDDAAKNIDELLQN